MAKITYEVAKMGQAKNRGTYEQRKSAAIKRRSYEIEAERKETLKLEKEAREKYYKLTPEQRAVERKLKKCRNDALMGYHSISLGMLGDYKFRI